MAVLTMNGAVRVGSGSGDITRVQIYKYVTRDRVLDISDMLNLEARRSKIALTLVEYDEKYKAQTRVRHFADAPDFKLVCWDILHGTFTEWADHKGSPTSGSGGEGEGPVSLQARVLTLRKDVKYRQPFVFKIDNGVGEGLPGGAVKMARENRLLNAADAGMGCPPHGANRSGLHPRLGDHQLSQAAGSPNGGFAAAPNRILKKTPQRHSSLGRFFLSKSKRLFDTKRHTRYTKWKWRQQTTGTKYAAAAT